MRSRKSDEGIVGALLHNRSKLRGIATRAGREQVDDVVQDAMVGALNAAQSQTIDKPDHLVAKIVKRVAIRHARRRVVREAHSRSSAREEAIDTVLEPERVLQGRQRLSRALQTIDSMPEKRRAVFMMHRVEELTYSQIATRLGISLKAVEKHMCKALADLVKQDE